MGVGLLGLHTPMHVSWRLLQQPHMEHLPYEVDFRPLPLEAQLPPVVRQALVDGDGLRLPVGGHDEVLAVRMELHVRLEYLLRARRQPLREAAVGGRSLMPLT